MKFSAWYFIFVGILMFGQWSFFLATGSDPEVQTTPLALAFHLAAEFITALLLVVAGIGFLPVYLAIQPLSARAILPSKGNGRW